MMNPTEVKKLREKAPLPALITLIMYFAPSFVLIPHFENLAVTEASYDASLKTATEVRQQKASDAVLKEKYAKLASEAAALDGWLPPESDLPLLIDRINETASLLGIEISSVRYEIDRSPATTLPPCVTLRFDLNADYVGIRAFMQAVRGIRMPLLLTEVTANENRNFTISMIHLVKP